MGHRLSAMAHVSSVQSLAEGGAYDFVLLSHRFSITIAADVQGEIS